MIKILRKEGWKLNDSDKIVNAILKRCEANDGLWLTTIIVPS